MLHKKFFTLTELLVVIAILAILVSLLSTSLRRVVERQDQIVCMNNLNQIGQLVHFFEQDKGELPTAWGLWAIANDDWIWQIGKYKEGFGATWLKNPWKQLLDPLLDCPSREDTPVGIALSSNFAWNWCGPSEGVRNDGLGLVDEKEMFNEGGRQKISSIRRPDRCIMIGPSWNGPNQTGYNWVMVPRERLLTPNNYAKPSYVNHRGEENLLMVNGSVIALSLAELISDVDLWRR